MSAFDDEFGLFGDDEGTPQEEERKPTLGARKIASNETIIDDIEPEDDRPPRRRPGAGSTGGNGGFRARTGGGERRRYMDPRPRSRDRDPAVAQARAGRAARIRARLVSKPDEVIVEVVEGIAARSMKSELHPDDFGGHRQGRSRRASPAHDRACRCRGKVTIDIVDVEDDEGEARPQARARCPSRRRQRGAAPTAGDTVEAEPAKKNAPPPRPARRRSAGTAAKRPPKTLTFVPARWSAFRIARRAETRRQSRVGDDCAARARRAAR